MHISMSREVYINSFRPNGSLYYQLVKKCGPDRDGEEKKSRRLSLPFCRNRYFIPLICLSVVSQACIGRNRHSIFFDFYTEPFNARRSFTIKGVFSIERFRDEVSNISWHRVKEFNVHRAPA